MGPVSAGMLGVVTLRRNATSLQVRHALVTLGYGTRSERPHWWVDRGARVAFRFHRRRASGTRSGARPSP